MQNKISKILLLLATLLNLSALCVAQEIIQIGAILPLSGEASSMGVACQNGMKLAWEEFPKDLQGRVKLSFEDDGLKSVNTVAAFRKLVNIESAAAVITFSSGPSLSVSPLADAQNVPVVAFASDENVVKDRKYSVNFWVTPDTEAQVMLPEMKRRGYKRIARITTIQSGVEAVSRAFDRENKGKVPILLDEQYSPDTKDFKPYLSKLSTRTDVDATMLLLMPGHLGLFAVG